MKCKHCGKHCLPGVEFCSLSCDAAYVMNRKPKAGTYEALLAKGLISLSIRAVEFSPKADSRGAGPRNKPTLWEARASDGQNGDIVARRNDPDDAMAAAQAAFLQHKKPARRSPPEDEDDDGHDLI